MINTAQLKNTQNVSFDKEQCTYAMFVSEVYICNGYYYKQKGGGYLTCLYKAIELDVLIFHYVH